MSAKQLPILLLVSFIGFTTLTCKDRGEIVSPVDPQFARPAKVTPPEPKLEEFWVYEDTDEDSECSGGQVIHIVVSGGFEFIGTSLVHDQFFNGIRDMSFHFEYSFRGPEYPPTAWNDGRTEGHIDVCFQGEQLDHIYGDGSGGLRYFVDYPSTFVAGTDGADPFAITVAAVIDSDVNHFDNRVFRPTGVVVNGDTGEPEAGPITSSWHPGETFGHVRSYAVWNSEPPAGHLFFEDIEVLEASCQVSTVIAGKGKNKTEVVTTTLTAEVGFDFGAVNLGDLIWNQDYWAEGHLRVTPSTGPGLVSGYYRTPRQDGSATYTWSIEGGDLAGQEIDVEFLADFLIAQSAPADWEGENVFDYVYNPGLNPGGLGTTAGFDGAPWPVDNQVPQEIFDELFPVAYSNHFPVTCGQG
jgi:hypothetical protein